LKSARLSRIKHRDRRPATLKACFPSQPFTGKIFMPPITASLHLELEKRLRQMRRDLTARVRSRLESESPDDPVVISLLAHMAQNDDMPTADMIGDDELRLLAHEDRELHEINVALGRLESGGAGICIVCGREISEDRLLATPTVDKCLDCAALVERQDRTGPGPSM
jgi:RNA polymerase-binding transcription factor DksA